MSKNKSIIYVLKHDKQVTSLTKIWKTTLSFFVESHFRQAYSACLHELEPRISFLSVRGTPVRAENSVLDVAKPVRDDEAISVNLLQTNE